MPVAVAAGTFDGEVGAPLPPKLCVSFSQTTLRCGLKPSPGWVMGPLERCGLRAGPEPVLR